MGSETNPTAALSSLDDLDCVVSDYDMPDVDGLGLLDDPPARLTARHDTGDT